jgi:SAM-dependent methyltransferase
MLGEDKADNIARYRTRYAEFGYDPRTLGWTKGRQKVRFAAALERIGTPFGSILDVGCGFGDLFGHLRDRGWAGDYLGIDIVPELVAEARYRFGPQGAKFECVDITDGTLDRQADVAVAIGMFNHRLREDNLHFIRDTLSAMWQRTTHVLVADFLSASADQPREDLYYADPAEILRLSLGWSKRALLNHAYMPFEFNVRIWHDDTFTADSPVFENYREMT